MIKQVVAWQKVRVVASLFLALLLAFLGQRYLRDRTFVLDGFVYYLASIVLFFRVSGLGREGVESLQRIGSETTYALRLSVPTIDSLSRPLTFGAFAVVLAAIAYSLSGGNTWRMPGVIAWIGSCVAILIAFWEPPSQSNRQALIARIQNLVLGLRQGIRIPRTVLLLAMILVVGAFFLFYDLNQVPAEMTSDHAEKLLDIKDVLDGKRPIFFPRNTGREPAQFYLTVFFMRLFGWDLSHFSLKWVTALIGWLTIPALFLLARELFNDKVGLVAAFLLSVSKWHVTISRMGLRYPLTGLPLALALYFLLRGFRRGERNNFLFAGLILGLGLYGYIPTRFLPVTMAVLVALKILLDWPVLGLSGSTRLILNTVLGFTVAAVIFVPLGRFMIDYPQIFWYRAFTRVADWERPLPGDLIHIFLSNLKNSLLMFNWRGDVVWVTNVSMDPALDYVSGALFVLGVTYALWRLLRYREVIYAYILATGLIFLMPSTLSLAFPSENPSLVRSAGALPMVAILVALPLYLSWRELRRILGSIGSYLGAFGLVIVLALIAWLNYRWYFRDYADNYRMSAWNSTEMGAVVRGFATSVGDSDHVWLVAWPHWVDGRNVAINMGDITWANFIMSPDQLNARTQDPGLQLFLLNVADQGTLSRLQELFPSGQVREFHSKTPGKDFLVFFIPPGTLR